MYKRVLVAFDGSSIAERALHEALRLAKENRAAVRVVHMVDVMLPITSEVYIDYEAYRRDRVQEGRRVLAAAEAAARAAGVDAETELLELDGPPISEGIVAEARRWSAELIVMGTHGRGGLMHLLLGSVSEGVVRDAPVPVLLLRGAEE
jgi:nucleotide-binding universal stress UspA family protein